MTKTLSEINPNATVDISPGAILKYPILAAIALDVIANWARADASLIKILTLCIKADFKAVSASLAALNSPQAQREAALAGIEAALPADDFKLIKAAINSTSEDRKIRDKFAHQIWGISPQIPDSLVLASPKSLSVAFSQVIENLVRTRKKGQGNFDKLSMLVFFQADLEAAQARSLRAARLIHNLGHVAIYPAGSPKGDAMRNELQKDPEISQCLLALSRQKPPQVKQR